ncbi:MAG: hypothetical protein K5622_04685, partial [Endomicrobiaceae bacterium]|nr:hypothetical protein [Endomicrobiaceae bacterium]
MKKFLLLFNVVACLIFCSLGVYAATDNNIPKKINLQGRYTKSYGDPVSNTSIRVYFQVKNGSTWESVSGSPFSTTTDSEGLYNLNIPVDLSSNATAFRVGIDSEPTGDGYTFASNPYSFYSSTSTYALSLDPVNGDKLVDGNFDSNITYSIKVASSNITTTLDPVNGDKLVDGNFDSTITYKIKVDFATLADTANNAMNVSTQTAAGKADYVWGITDNNGTQSWVKMENVKVGKASSTKIGGIRLKNSFFHDDPLTGLDMDGRNGEVLKIKNGAGLIINSSNELILDTSISNLTNYTKTSDLATVATSGKYSDLTEKLTAGTNITITGTTISAQNTTYTGSNGITLTGTNFTNSGVRSVATGTADGTISVNTNGTAADVAVKGLKTVATSGKYSDLTEKLTAGTNITITGTTISAQDTTYTGSDGITLTGTNFTNSGVRSVATGTADGTISVNTNGTAADVAVKG